MIRHGWLVIAGLALTAAPALAQHEQHGQQQKAAEHGDMMTHMVCEMGMLPLHGGGMGGMMPGMMPKQEMPAMPGRQPGVQQGQPEAAGQGMKHGEAGQGMAHAMDHTRTAHMLWEHGDEMGLALTEDQKTKMNQLAVAAKSTCETHLQAAHAAHAAALTALEQNDLDEYEDKLEDAAEHMIQAHVPVISSGIEAKALLTKEQRDAASGIATGRRQKP
ncbi:MAG TPA: Spy/CpxP family protein refolding chaperone [Longimicrobiales bacterium]|nr:Spy/CpxP family protein refolding chaperone [Longimicrobiales bacterium]